MGVGPPESGPTPNWLGLVWSRSAKDLQKIRIRRRMMRMRVPSPIYISSSFLYRTDTAVGSDARTAVPLSR